MHECVNSAKGYYNSAASLLSCVSPLHRGFFAAQQPTVTVMTQLFECVDGPYRGFIVSLDPGQNRVQVRDLAGKMAPEWYEVDASVGAASLVWLPKPVVVFPRSEATRDLIFVAGARVTEPSARSG